MFTARFQLTVPDIQYPLQGRDLTPVHYCASWGRITTAITPHNNNIGGLLNPFIRRLSPLALALSAGLVLSGCSTLPGSGQVSLAPPHAPLIEGEPVPVVPHPDPESLLYSADPQLAANKRMAWDLWRTVLNGGHVEEAGKYLAPY